MVTSWDPAKYYLNKLPSGDGGRVAKPVPPAAGWESYGVLGLRLEDWVARNSLRLTHALDLIRPGGGSGCWTSAPTIGSPAWRSWAPAPTSRRCTGHTSASRNGPSR